MCAATSHYLCVTFYLAHCHLEEDVVTFQRLANDPEIVCVLKTIERFISDQVSKFSGEGRRYLNLLHERASTFFELQGI